MILTIRGSLSYHRGEGKELDRLTDNRSSQLDIGKQMKILAQESITSQAILEYTGIIPTTKPSEKQDDNNRS